MLTHDNFDTYFLEPMRSYFNGGVPDTYGHSLWLTLAGPVDQRGLPWVWCEDLTTAWQELVRTHIAGPWPSFLECKAAIEQAAAARRERDAVPKYPASLRLKRQR